METTSLSQLAQLGADIAIGFGRNWSWTWYWFSNKGFDGRSLSSAGSCR